MNADELQVNTEQAGVSDVISKQQIDSLPVNGRNFLDLAQIEPGVILQSGESFDPQRLVIQPFPLAASQAGQLVFFSTVKTSRMRTWAPPFSTCHKARSATFN